MKFSNLAARSSLATSLRCGLFVITTFCGVVSTAQANQWKITTYFQVVGNPPINGPRLADQYFMGSKPQRFTGMGTVTLVDLWEGGPSGSFSVNHPFPGLDNLPGPENTDNFTVRITGTLDVNAAGRYEFFTRGDSGSGRMWLDLFGDGIQEHDLISLYSRPPFSISGSRLFTLAAGTYPFEVRFFDNTGGASIEAYYRVNDVEGSDFLIGDPTGGIGLTGPATVRTVGAAMTGGGGPDITNFAQADALRTGPNEPGFPVTESREIFSMLDSWIPRTEGPIVLSLPFGAPGLGRPSEDDDDDFLVVGSGVLVIPAGGISGAIFRSTTVDGGRLLIDTNQDGDLLDASDIVIFDDGVSTPHHALSQPVSLAEGNYMIEYSFFEREGGRKVQ